MGDYTAAAIASFAFDVPKAAVDGNVCRVWARLFGMDAPIDTARGKQQITEVAQALLPVEHAAKYNQAVMEFGALQCTPQSPKCDECPLAHKCVALATGRVSELPVKSHKTKVTPRYMSYLYVHDGERVLLHKRTANDIWLNLYELPLIETATPVGSEEIFGVPEFMSWHAMMPDVVYRGATGPIKHVLSHRVLHTIFYELETGGSLPCPEGFVAVPFEELEHYALPRLIEKYLEEKIG